MMAIRQAFGLLAGLVMGVLSGPAMSATLNFTNYIDTVAGEHAVTANFSHATLGGYTISAHGSTVSNINDPVPVGFNNYNTIPQAYFDRGGAGIGGRKGTRSLHRCAGCLVVVR